MTTTTLARIAPPDTLEDLRAEIDAIDAQLLALIAQRLGIADRVRAVKPGGVTLFRPEREIAMLARVSAGPIPAPLANTIWRAFIGAMLAREGLTRVVADPPELVAVARARFSGQLPVVAGDARAAAGDPHQLGVVDTPGDLPEGVRVLAPLDHEDGTSVGWFIGRAVPA